MLHFVRPAGTVRNITASELAGVDAEKPFDVSYAHALFQFFIEIPYVRKWDEKSKYHSLLLIKIAP
jgi:hypothetical protein